MQGAGSGGFGFVIDLGMLAGIGLVAPRRAGAERLVGLQKTKMSDDFHKPGGVIPRQPQRPGELLLEFYVERDHERWLCELRDQDVYGTEAQFFEQQTVVS